MKITTKELRQAVELLLSHLEQKGQTEFHIDEDFYWDVSPESRYDQYAEPTEHSVGQLSEDWGNVRGIVNGSGEPLGYGLVWAANVLRRIGEKSVG